MKDPGWGNSHAGGVAGVFLRADDKRSKPPMAPLRGIGGLLARPGIGQVRSGREEKWSQGQSSSSYAAAKSRKSASSTTVSLLKSAKQPADMAASAQSRVS